MDGLLLRIRHRSNSHLRGHRRAAAAGTLPTTATTCPTTKDQDDVVVVVESECLSNKDVKEEDASRKRKKSRLPRTFSLFGGGLPFSVITLLGLVLILLTTIIALSVPAVRKYTIFQGKEFYRDYLWTVHPDTFTHECKRKYLHNDTWGRIVAPFVDKHQVKELVRSILRAQGRDDETLLKVAPTLALYDANNISLFTLDAMQSFPQPYLIKPTHTSGGIARVVNDTYECFKECEFGSQKPLSPLKHGFGPAIDNIQHTLVHPFRHIDFETQYRYMPPQIIIEEHIPMDGLREFQWYTVNGHPVFARCRCAPFPHRNNTFYSAGLGELPSLQIPVVHKYMKDPCEKFDKPKAYSRMMEAVRVLGRHFPGMIVRIDLYINDLDVYFGELTFTSAACRVYFQPAVADRLLYALLHGGILPDQATPEFVERLINEPPWFRVSVVSKDEKQRGLTHNKALSAFFSESDLCKQTDAPAACLDATRDVRSFPLRCILVEGQDVTALGQEELPLLSTFVRGLDILSVLGIAMVLVMMAYLNRGGKPRNRMESNACFLLAVTIRNCLKAHCKSLASPVSVFLGIMKRSFQAFVMVHAIENKPLVLTHFATYWLAIAAWRASRPRRMLLWWLLYEVLALGVNELFHAHEEYHEFRCARISFIHSTEHYALDETIREYILPPIFVYGYLLPKQLLCWIGLVGECGSREPDFQTLYVH